MSQPPQVIIATDCGSTTTKAILIEKKGGEYRQTFRGEAPTTWSALQRRDGGVLTRDR
jgi:sugar (pentulose or hexulose) kinase